MTVETNTPTTAAAASASASTSQQQSTQPVNITRRSRNDVIKTIQEITPCDEATINRAIEACQDNEGRYSIDQVLNMLMDDRCSFDYPQDSKNAYNNMNYSGNSGNQRTYSNSNDDKHSNNKNLNKSFYSQNSRVNLDNDYSSLNDDEEINNEADLIRDNVNIPCGLKNVGNTCWFNSIIQALFHLPYIRKLLISYQITSNSLDRLDDNSKNVVQFIFELRKLFALLLKSKRKAINPQNSLRVLRNCSRYNVSNFNQEDVSEFSTILVNLIEESFEILFKLEQQTATTSLIRSINDLNINEPTRTTLTSTSATSISTASPTTTTNTTTPSSTTATPTKATIESTSFDELSKDSRKNRKNPIVNLLNGDMIISRKNNADADQTVLNNRTETFREINIQMLNSRNLHEGLELEWGETSIDTAAASSSTNGNAKPLNESLYEQESWLTKLPSVLFICLNRYKFVKATQSSSKILEPFEFYQHIYLDRYLYSNRERIKLKRKELKLLKSELQLLEEKLKTIKCHNFNNKTYALDDVLSCTLNFAKTDHTNELFDKLEPKPTDRFVYCDEVLTESERLHRQSLNGLKECLESWINEIKNKISELEIAIKSIKEKIDKIYDDNDLKKVKYNLHSVCVHEGSAALGHFWTYIWNKTQQKWYKFNDTEVCESTWDDLYANAIGGVTSAYFLIYVNANEDNLYQEPNELTNDLVKLIDDDQNLLKIQLNGLRLKIMLKNLQERLKKIPAAPALSNDIHQICIEHAKAFSDSTMEAFQVAFDDLIDKTPDEAFKHAIDIEVNKYIETPQEILNKLPDNDLRTIHILTYLSANNASRELREFALIDIYRIQVFTDNDTRIKILQAVAQIKYNEIMNDLNKQELIKQYEKLQCDYRDYRSIIAAFITACGHLEVEKYQDAAEFYCVSCEFNERVTSNLKVKLRGMDHDLLLKCRRRCLKLWNEAIIKKITKTPSQQQQNLRSLPVSPNSLNNLDASIGTADLISFENVDRQRLIEIMINKFLPCFNRMANSTNEDKLMIEEIRQDWLAILDNNLAELQIFQDFMTKLFEEQYANHYHQLTVNKGNLFERYKDTVSLTRDHF